MKVTHLSLTDFRNYAGVEIALAEGPNLFVGANGQGKTNLVESLGYLSTLGSHRVSVDQAMIRQGADSAIVRARLRHEDRELLVEVELNRATANRAKVNRSMVKLRELPRYFSSVLFAPEDLAIIRGEPGVRRRFIDQLLVQRTPRLAGVFSDYDRVLKQRNMLLKSARTSGIAASQLSTLDIWDERLVGFGSEIIDERLRLIQLLAEPVQQAYRVVAGDDHHPRMTAQLSIDGPDLEAIRESERQPAVPVNAAQLPRTSTAQRFGRAITGLRRKELERGVTLVGPHRDDILFELNSLPTKGYASHGESWSFALALKLGSAELLKRDSVSGDPVLMLDDVFAELDQSRRRRLAEAVRDFEQVIVTAAVLEDVPAELAAHTVRISAGAVIPEGDANAIRG
ncbi:MAG: DNA replication/repair protein RecF [Microbacteriaceae bacterium]